MLTFDKVKNLELKNAKQIMRKIKNKVVSSQFDFGGVKETYRPQDKNMKLYFDHIINMSDIVAFVVREPKALYNSFKLEAKRAQRKRPMPLARLFADYKSLYDQITKNIDKSVVFTLEDFCNAGNTGIKNYIRNKSGDNINIKGKFELHPTDYKYGNSVANRSKKIMPPNINISLLSGQEKRQVNNELYSIYTQLAEWPDLKPMNS